MNEGDNYAIKDLPLFRRMVQPLTEMEIEKLKNNIINSTEPRIIYTWRGNHLQDQQKYEICNDLHIPVCVSEKYFDDWTDAAIFLCKNQLKRKDLTSEYKKYLIGLYLHYSMIKSGELLKAESKTMLSIEIGKEQFISSGTVQKYNLFSDAISYIFEASEELAERILMGKTRISHENTIELSRLSKEEIRSISNSVMKENVDYITLAFIRNEVKWSHIQEKDIVSRRERSERKAYINAGIRQMPQYNPDSEVNSLCMTIDSWISSIERVKKSDNFSKITGKASLQLMNKLTSLEHTISSIQDSLMERTSV